MTTPPDPAQSIGVDTGGTFTDVVCRDPDGSLRVHKRLSTPHDPSEAIAGGVAALRAPGCAPPDIVHGTTVATNALLERCGAKVAFVTTAGFEDLLFLRRQNRPDLYAFDIELPAPLVAPACCFGVAERVLHDGRVHIPLGDDAIDELLTALDRAGEGGEEIEAVAICLLHSYANDDHERRIARAIRRARPDLHVSASSEVLREFREYERASTTAVNAFVGPVMARYLAALAERVPHGQLEILQSSGGRTSPEHAARLPVHTVLSGPAGGVVGARAAGREIGMERIISFDMGGTSTDVSLCEGEPTLSTESTIDGLPVHVPVLDIYTVGAGGGSIARVDAGGALRVGPRSAGADPGPAAYGRGGRLPTVTDAHVVLGRLRPERFLGGEMSLDLDAAHAAVGELAGELGMSVEAAAEGIVAVANAAMVRAIKVISLERGFDPRDFTLVSFGGAGGLHACDLAEALEMSRVLVPRHPGLLSAYGMLHADAARLYAQTVLSPLDALLGEPERIATLLDAMAAEAGEAMGRVDEVEVTVDLRYQGQSFEISVPVSWRPGQSDFADPAEAFARRHETLYGYRADDRPIEAVTLRLRAVRRRAHVGGQPVAGGRAADVADAVEAEAAVVFDGVEREARIVERAAIGPDGVVDGPAIISEYSGTTVVPPGWSASWRAGHLLLERGAEQGGQP